MGDRRVSEDSAFGCAFCKDGIVVFESDHIFPDIDCDVSGFDPTTRTKPVIVGNGAIFDPHPAPNWIGRYNDPSLRAQRNLYNAAKNSAVCARCLVENPIIAKLIALGRLKVITELNRY